MSTTKKTLLGAALTAAMSTGASAGDLEQRWLEMIASGEAYPAETLLPLFEQLQPVDTEFMLGTWKGGKFDGGAEPDPINWYGKRFNSTTDVEPLLVLDADGKVQTFDKLGEPSFEHICVKGIPFIKSLIRSSSILDVSSNFFVI